MSSTAPTRLMIIPLKGGRRFAIVDSTDFERLSKFVWYEVAGAGGLMYAARSVGRRNVFMHREILGLTDARRGDHWNGDGLDNRRENLRPCTHAQNCANRKPRIGTSSYKGVTWHKGQRKWVARVRVAYKLIHLGSFDDEILAAKAYDRAASGNFGEFAPVNFPTHRRAP